MSSAPEYVKKRNHTRGFHGSAHVRPCAVCAHVNCNLLNNKLSHIT